MTDARPLIAHAIYRLDFGGLENGLVNIINRMDPDKFRHAILCVTDATDFAQRITIPGVPIIALNKPQRSMFGFLLAAHAALRQLKPDILHTRNLPALDVIPASLVMNMKRVHGEHGRDVIDLDGRNIKYQRYRRALNPFVDQFVALSADLERWLVDDVRIPAPKVTRICNGVDVEKFQPRMAGFRVADCPFRDPDAVLIGTVGRMQTVKNTTALVKSFINLISEQPTRKRYLRLALVGDGPLREECLSLLSQAGLMGLVWAPGARDDIADVMASLDIFVLPSLAEGISNTILEAMACGVPVVATDVGGNSELIEQGKTGLIVPLGQPEQFRECILQYADNGALRHKHGEAARTRVEKLFSIPAMVTQYTELYEQLIN